MLSQKCQYAVRAMYELARRGENGPVTTGKLAEAQAIPEQFLEVIMGELKQGGFVISRRGRKGGYRLSRGASDITVGQVIRHIEGRLGPVACVSCVGSDCAALCAFGGDCVFLPLWKRAYEAAASVYDGTSLGDLVVGTVAGDAQP